MPSDDKDKRCVADIFYDRGGSCQCQNTAKVFVDGKGYCGVHDPVKRKEREEARNRKREEEYKRKEVRWAQAEAERQRPLDDLKLMLWALLEGGWDAHIAPNGNVCNWFGGSDWYTPDFCARPYELNDVGRKILQEARDGDTNLLKNIPESDVSNEPDGK